MGEERITGNGNFDIDAITRSVRDMSAQAIDAGNYDVDPLAEAFTIGIEDMVDELAANPGSELKEEAEQALRSPLVHRLDRDVTAALRSVIALNEERKETSFDGAMRRDVWTEIRERNEKESKEQAKVADFAGDTLNGQQRLTEQQWDEGSYDFAGERMTGAEIDNLISFMRSPANRQRLIEQRARANGISTEQASREVDMGLRYAELFRKTQMGTATREERAEFERLRADPTAIDVVRDARALSRGEQPTPAIAASSDARNGDVAISVAGRQARLDTGFAAGAPPLRASFASAQAATTPLDAPSPQIAAASPALSAGEPPPQLASTGMTF